VHIVRELDIEFLSGFLVLSLPLFKTVTHRLPLNLILERKHIKRRNRTPTKYRKKTGKLISYVTTQ